MDGIYDLRLSNVGADGTQYYYGMLEPERLDERGLLTGKGFSIDLNHKRQTSTILKYNWIGGAPRNIEVVAILKDEIVSETEIPALLRKYKMLKE